jgi:glutaredoxin-related protein
MSPIKSHWCTVGFFSNAVKIFKYNGIRFCEPYSFSLVTTEVREEHSEWKTIPCIYIYFFYSVTRQIRGVHAHDWGKERCCT